MPQHSPLRPNAPLPAQRRPAPLPAPRRAPALHPPRPADLRSRPGAGVPFAATGAANGTAPVADPPRPSKLTINKIVAGAGAAATSAVAGSLFGAAGTVLGAALGSVVSTLAAAVYEHSLDRTRDTVKARIKLPGGRTVDVAGKVEVPAPRVAAGGETGQAHVYVAPAESTNRRSTMVLPSASPARPRRRWVALTALALGVFLLGLLAVTGVELLKGSTLTRGETGTSVGRVVDPRPVPADPTEPTETGPTTTTETAERTATSATSTIESTTEATATESVTDESDGGTGRTAGGSSDAPEDSSVDDEADVDATSAATPTPTPTRSPDGD